MLQELFTHYTRERVYIDNVDDADRCMLPRNAFCFNKRKSDCYHVYVWSSTTDHAVANRLSLTRLCAEDMRTWLCKHCSKQMQTYHGQGRRFIQVTYTDTRNGFNLDSVLLIRSPHGIAICNVPQLGKFCLYSVSSKAGCGHALLARTDM